MTLDEAMAHVASLGYYAHIRQARASVGCTRIVAFKEWWVSLFCEDHIRHGYADTLIEAIEQALIAEPVSMEAIRFERTDPDDAVPFDVNELRSALKIKPRPILRRI